MGNLILLQRTSGMTQWVSAGGENVLAFDWSCQDSAKRSGWAASCLWSQSEGCQSGIMISLWIWLAHNLAGMMSSNTKDPCDSELRFQPNTLGSVQSYCTYVISMSHVVTNGWTKFMLSGDTHYFLRECYKFISHYIITELWSFQQGWSVSFLSLCLPVQVSLIWK